MSQLLEAVGLVKHFPVQTGLFGRVEARVKAVDGVSFAVDAGETFAIVGESGCGKSTVARLVLRLIEPTAGELRLEGRDLLNAAPAELRRLRGKLQIVFQDPYGSLNPRMTVGDMLAEPLMLHEVVAPSQRNARVAELLSLVGLRAEAAGRYPHEFSGGQRQRIAIARALAANPRVIVCDEPVSALDVSIQAQILNLLAELQRRFSLAYLFISHDLAVVRQIATKVAVMYLGRFVETGAADRLFARPRHPYARALLAAVPVPVPGARTREAALGGDVPSPIAPPPGCRFHTRCPQAIERCRVEEPVLEPTPEGGAVACLRWRELDGEAFGAARRAPDNPALARLQAAFARATAEAKIPA
ncbi:MAG: ABC transporter ATP-binding protein [Betaproteobacteria bacterium]|nr:MAG: ABC transporter ATP-binding protein [Betaproteobacteria bacterium]